VRKFLTFAYKGSRTEVNLATHFRIRKQKTSLGLRTDEMSATSGQEMTRDGYEQLLTEKDSLESHRPSISEAIHKAASDGDVRENAPLEAAREQQGREESRIKEIDNMLRTAIIVDSSGKGTKRVRVGVTIHIEDIFAKKRFKYTLVSPSEASPIQGKISDASPLGKAFLGKRAGQRATAETPKGSATFKILNIS
jgi:transcription elongation factor GreA